MFISITPGTEFMKKLDININYTFTNANKYGLNKLIVSCSDEPGEGEHKLYKYIRDCPDEHKKFTTVIYGLDADLMMLSMIRKHKVYLLRERTEYNIEDTDSEFIYLNIDLLKK